MTRTYLALVHALAVAAAAVLGLVAVLVTLDVVGRNMRIGGLTWINEVSEYSLPLATFLVAPWLLERAEHVRLDILVQSIGGAAARWIERAANLIGLAVCVVFVVFGTRLIADSFSLGAKLYKSLEIPEWWTFAPVPLSFALMAVGFMRRMR